MLGVPTQAGVIVFDVAVLPSGRVSDVRLVKEVDSRHPWPTLVERWRAAISAWRHEPAVATDTRVAICMTVVVLVHVS